MKGIFVGVLCVITLGLLPSTMAGEKLEVSPTWPSARVQLDKAVSSAFQIVTAVAIKDPEVTRQPGAFMDGRRTYAGGSYMDGAHTVYAHCRQEFSFVEFLYGKGSLKNRVIEYSFREISNVLPMPQGAWKNESSIPKDSKVILVLDDKGKLLKVLPDTEINREEIKRGLASLKKTQPE
jgi:hypothetical protein